MQIHTPTRYASTNYPAIISDTAIVFLSGYAWDHPQISCSVRSDMSGTGLSCVAVRRAVDNWNSAIGASPIRRLRQFRQVPPTGEQVPDISIVLRGDAEAPDARTEIVSRSDGGIVRATVTLDWPASGHPDDLGILATVAVRGLGRALGLGHAADPADPMYPTFNGIKLRPSPWDIAAFGVAEAWYLAKSPFFYPPRGFSRCWQPS